VKKEETMGPGLLKKDGFYGWVSLSAVGMVMFFMSFVMVSFGVFLPTLCRELGWRRGDVSIAFSAYFMMMSCTAAGAGFFVHKYGARKSIVLGNMLIALGLLALSFISRQWQFVALYAVMGVGAGFAGYMACNTVATAWFVRKVPLALSVVLGLGGIGGLAGAPFVMALINNLSWRTVYLVLSGVLFLCAAVIPGLLVRNKPEELGQAPDGIASPAPGTPGSHAPKPKGIQYVAPVDFTLKQAMATAPFWYMTLFVMGDTFLSSILSAHQIAYLTSMGIGRHVAALTIGVLSGMRAVGTVAIGVLALKYDLKKLTVGTAGVIILGMILTLLTVSAPMAFAYSIILGIGYGAGLVGATSFIPSYYGRSHFSKIMGVSSIFLAAGGLGAPMAGYVFDLTGSYKPALGVGVVIAVLILVCMALMKPPLHPSLQTSERKP
jgi:MFS family permease